MNAVEQIATYTAHVYFPDDWVEVRCLCNRKVRKFWRAAGDLPGLVPELERLNREGFNIYVGPNPRRVEGLSGDKNVAVCRCLFCDFDRIDAGDGCGIWEFVEPRIEAAGLPMPSMAVFSGHGIHAYWRLDEPLPPDRWRAVQSRLIATLGSDPACSNPERVMRLPGFLNVKNVPHTDCFIIFAEVDG